MPETTSEPGAGSHGRKPTRLSGKTLAALGAAGSEHTATADGCATAAEAMAPLADELGRLIGAFHGDDSVSGHTKNRERGL